MARCVGASARKPTVSGCRGSNNPQPIDKFMMRSQVMKLTLGRALGARMTPQGEMILRIWDVEHGACAMLEHQLNGYTGRLAMIDSGCTEDWRPSTFIKNDLGRNQLDYLFITNADQDHMSDLDGLWQEGIAVKTLTRNPHPPADELRKIKAAGGTSDDIERFLSIHASYNGPVTRPFNDYMGGITKKTYFNKFPEFKDTNNLSCAVVIEFAGFKMLFPGDLEKAGWQALLKREDFRQELTEITVLVAAHHGRENGYHEEVFNYCRPCAVVMSDKAIVHSTQGMTQTYRQRVIDNWPQGVLVATTMKRRRVLTTRRDGWIQFAVDARGDFTITTEYMG
jgi:beta-lactamase superfamily II metal-dependent hydrolase